MRKKRNVLYLMMLIMLALGLVFTPAEVNASGVTTDTGEESEQTEQAISPITPTSSVIAESVEASEGWTAEPPSIVGLTIEQDDIDEEDEEKATWTLRAKLTGIPTIATYVYLMIGEEEPDGNVYYKTEAYLSSSEIRDAVNGTLKIAKKVEVSNGWKPSVGQELTVAVMCEGKSYPSGEYKFTTSGYKKTYKVTAGKKRLEKKRKAKLRRLKVSYKNHNNRLIAFSKTFYYEEGAAYTIPALKINGYSMSSASQSALTGKMGAEDATVDIAYEGDTVPVKVSFVSGEKEVATAYNENKKVGDAYSVPVPKVEGYVLSSDAANTYDSIKGIVPAGGVDRKVNYYEKKCRLVINHLNENGKELYPQADSYQLKPGESYEISEAVRTFDGYTLADDENINSLIQEVQKKDSDGNIVTDDGGNPIMIKVIKGTMPDEDKEVTLNYTRNTAHVKINIGYEGVNDSVEAPADLPKSFTDELPTREDYHWKPPVIDGWTLVATMGGYSERYDARKNLLTIPGMDGDMLHSTADHPYEFNMVYKQNVTATMNYNWDDSAKEGKPAEAKTVTVLAGEKETVKTPIVDGYVCSRGTSTEIVANEWKQDENGALYYSPYTWEDGRKIVEGTPGEGVVYDANWDAANPDAPFTIDVIHASWTAGMDKDNLCTFNKYGSGENVEVYIGGDAKTGELVSSSSSWGTVASSASSVSFTIDSGSDYFRKNHDKFTYTVYEERRLTGETVYVKTTFTADLSIDPSKDDNSAYYTKEIKDEDITVANVATVNKNWDETKGNDYNINVYDDRHNYRIGFDTDSSSWDMGYVLTWTLSKDDLTAFGDPGTYGWSYQNIDGAVYASYKTVTGEEKRIRLDRCAFSWTEPGTDGSTTVKAGINGYEASGDGVSVDSLKPEFNDAVGDIAFEIWCKIGNGWLHANKTVTRKDFKAKDDTPNNMIDATTTTYKEYYSDYSDSYDEYEVQWVDKNNNYNDYWASSDTTPNNLKSTISYAMLGANGNGVYADGKLIGEVVKVENTMNVDYNGYNGQDSEDTVYKATVRIRRGSYSGVSGKKFSFTLWNMGVGHNIGTSDEPSYVIPMTTDGVNEVWYYPAKNENPETNNGYYHYKENSELQRLELVKNMTTTITATVGDEDSIVSGVTEFTAPTITSDSTVDLNGAFDIKLNVSDTIKNAFTSETSSYTKNEKKLMYKVYVCNAEAENATTTINPVLEKDVYGQGYLDSDVYGNGSTKSLSGNVLNIAGNLNMKKVTYPGDTYNEYKEKFIPGEKYKVAVVLEGYTVPTGAKSATYFTTKSYTTITMGEKPKVVNLDKLEITEATVTRSYEHTDGNMYPEFNIKWSAQMSGLSDDATYGFRASDSTYYGGSDSSTYNSSDVKVRTEIYNVENPSEDLDYYTGSDNNQRSHTLDKTGGTYKCYFLGTFEPKTIISRRYRASVTYTYKTYNKYGKSTTVTKTVYKDIIPESKTIEGEDVLFQVDNAGNALVRVTRDKNLNTPTATIWNDGKKYDEVKLQKETVSGSESVKNWYTWVDLSDGYGKALDATKFTATLSGTDYDANTFDESTKYPAIAKDFVTITKAKEKNGKFTLAYGLDIPGYDSMGEIFVQNTTYWSVSRKSDVEADNGAIVAGEETKVSAYSLVPKYEDSANKSSESGLYFDKFSSLAGKTLNVRIDTFNKDFVFTTSVTIGDEGATTPTSDVVITKAEYDINGNVKLEGTFNIEAVEKSSWRNTLNISTEGVDGTEGGAKFRMEASDGLTIDFEKGTFTCEGSAFTPSGNDIFGYTLRQFAGLSADAKKLKVSAALNDVESSEATFTYTGGTLKITDSMIKEGKDDDAGYLVVSLPRGYFTNAVDIGGVIATAIEGGKGLKFVSEEDDIEFSFDAATVATMTGEGDALLAVSKYTGEMPENVKKSGLNATTAYEIGLSRKYTGKAKVRFISEATLTEGATPGVFFVDADGKTEEMATTYSINQYEEVEAYSDLTHCSTFAVVYKGQQSPNVNVTVTFDANGGTGAMDPQVVKKGTATQLNANAFARDGFTFAGWATKKDATAAEYADKASVTFNADATLYAVWKANAGGGNEQGGQSGQSGDNGQTTTAPVTTIQDEISGGEYTVTTNAAGEQTAEFKTPLVKHTIIIIPAIVVVNGNECKVTSIADNAFKNDNSITSLTIGENVEIIGESAFEGCAKITTVVIPVSVKTIEKSAFEDCTSLKKIVIPSSVTTVGEKAFEGCNKLTTATISKGVTEIGTQAFANCTSLTKIVVPATVKKIGAQAFAGDKKLTNATVGTNVEEIGTKAFANCPKIKSITIPKKVKKLGNQIFTGDKSLKTITIKSNNLTAKNVSSKAFKGVNNKVTIKVPKSKKKAYTKLFRKKGLSKKVKIK